METTFLIVGGGIAGVTCTETLAFLEPDESIILLSESSLIKTVTNLHAITRTITNFDIEEKEAKCLTEKHSNVKVLHDMLVEIDDEEQTAKTVSNVSIRYKFLCLCVGAEPKLIPQSSEFPQVLGIRDTDSVEDFIKKLSTSKKIVVVGNGGIASEVVYKVKNNEVHWVVKDKHISATFVDPGAAEFFQPSISGNVDQPPIYKRMRYSENDPNKSGAALGPDWYKDLVITGANDSTSVDIHYECEVREITSLEGQEFPIEVTLTNNDKIQCDLVVSATGVHPRSKLKTKNKLDLSEDGGISVDQYMKTSLNNVYAAGDACTTSWPPAKHWFQMKLWTQARHMGCYAAKAMSGKLKNEEVLQDFCFEIFSHSTKLFGYKVILLGLYNGQKLGTDYEILLRMTKGLEYVKFVLQDHKLQGAILIGETDLEEMCENLILNQLDLSPYGDDILNPDIDIDDYFD